MGENRAASCLGQRAGLGYGITAPSSQQGWVSGVLKPPIQCAESEHLCDDASCQSGLLDPIELGLEITLDSQPCLKHVFRLEALCMFQSSDDSWRLLNKIKIFCFVLLLLILGGFGHKVFDLSIRTLVYVLMVFLPLELLLVLS